MKKSSFAISQVCTYKPKIILEKKNNCELIQMSDTALWNVDFSELSKYSGKCVYELSIFT